MISFFEANLAKLAVHYVGNVVLDQGYALSERDVDISDEVKRSLIVQYMLSPFQKSVEVFEFYHQSGDLELNEVYSLCRQLFADADQFQCISEALAKFLHSVSTHPKIKSGELYVALFENLQIEGELLPAIGIFKSETKESYLKVNMVPGATEVSYEQEAIGVNSLEKGCLIFNTGAKTGYKIVVINNAKGDAVYWTDEFLQLKVRKDDYQNTSDLLSISKQFIMEKLDDEFELSSEQKVGLLNKTLKYFNEKEVFDATEFNGEVLGNDAAIQSFEAHKATHAAEFDVKLPETFEISSAAVKKQAKAFKKVIKLDRNFQIHVTGNTDFIQRGYDQEQGMSFYKVFFKEEAV